MPPCSQLIELAGVASGPAKHARRSHRVAAEPLSLGDSLDLAAAFRADDASAARVLAERLLPHVTQLVRGLTAWSQDADDLVQDVLVTALASRKKFRGQSRLETWITRIAVNRCRWHSRKRWVRLRLLRAWRESQGPVRGSEAADERAMADERAALVRAAVAQLPLALREAVVLCYLQGLSVAEAAQVLSAARGTVEVRLTRARQQLRKLLPADFKGEPTSAWASGACHE
jgi:RNA polymerase sigma-70 factor (ECF subfamily)